jgi:flavin reductase (DIM6/NTAB) family NADH-FMN oxidoreductase RutF
MKKPWNRVSLPVYSVSSKGEKPNMHICTYVSAVSMQPKRILVALYYGTQTLNNVEQDGEFVLQLLAEDQYVLVNLLGKQSGKKIDKIARLTKRDLLTEWEGYKVLKQALAVMYLHAISTMDGGDHKLYLCNVVKYKNFQEGNPLTTSILSEKGLIRI